MEWCGDAQVVPPVRFDPSTTLNFLLKSMNSVHVSHRVHDDPVLKAPRQWFDELIEAKGRHFVLRDALLGRRASEG
jgi:hypothetical protein